MNLRLTICLLFVFSFGKISAQEQLGWMNDNYAGVNAIDLQPASIVDSRFKFDMSLVHFNYHVMNNYVGLKRWVIGDKGWDSPDFKDRYMWDRINDKNKSVYLNIQTALPVFNFMVSINQKNSFAITTKNRMMVNLDNVGPELAKLSFEELKYQPLWYQRHVNENLNINMMNWGEI